MGFAYQVVRILITQDPAIALMTTMPERHLAFACQSGQVHLCVLGADDSSDVVISVCRQQLDTKSVVAVDPSDLPFLQTFNICHGCSVRYNLLGYRAFYASGLTTGPGGLANQLNLF